VGERGREREGERLNQKHVGSRSAVNTGQPTLETHPSPSPLSPSEGDTPPPLSHPPGEDTPLLSPTPRGTRLLLSPTLRGGHAPSTLPPSVGRTRPSSLPPSVGRTHPLLSPTLRGGHAPPLSHPLWGGHAPPLSHPPWGGHTPSSLPPSEGDTPPPLSHPPWGGHAPSSLPPTLAYLDLPAPEERVVKRHSRPHRFLVRKLNVGETAAGATECQQNGAREQTHRLTNTPPRRPTKHTPLRTTSNPGIQAGGILLCAPHTHTHRHFLSLSLFFGVSQEVW